MNHSGTFLTARSAEYVFDLVADPQSFAPLLPDFESITVQDGSHFTLRIVIAVGQIHGHVNLAMELREATRPDRVEYRGEGIVAGSQLTFAMQFQIAALGTDTQVGWLGEVSVDGIMALMAGTTIDELGRRNFDAVAEHLQNKLREATATAPPAPAAPPNPDTP
jgi:carbon monoxide dehydrogenase subunit G